MYVHTAYIENSPNSICEAQCLGLPVVSTNVGGIATLVRQDIDGILVAANDPWQMADAIIELAKDPLRMLRYSENTRNSALERHNDENIKKQLMDCYYSVIY
jgi:glycosyltransferase involved in cell wall biosynthesis